ncbi:MAG: glucosyltransferase [Acidimicrobiia bacterium]
MRVALVNNFFPPRAGGSAHLTERLAKRLAAQGVEVLVLTASFGGAPAHEHVDGYEVVRLPSREAPKSKLTMRFDVSYVTSPANVRRVFSILDGFGPDVIHQHGQFFDLTFLTSLYARRRDVPTVLSVHTRLEHTSRAHDLVLRAGDVTLVRGFIALSRPTVVAMDRHMRDYIRRRYAVPPERIVPIPVGIEPTDVAGDAARARERLGLGDRPLVVSVGHVIAVRDRLALVEAMPALARLVPDAAVVVVGNVYDHRFLRRAEELGVRDALVLTGGVPLAEVADLLAAAAVEVHELQGIGLGTATLEAMAARVPVVAVAPVDNFLGFELRPWQDLALVLPDDPDALAGAIHRLVEDRALAEQLAVGQEKLVRERFTMEVVTAAHVELYERVSAGRGGRSGA